MTYDIVWDLCILHCIVENFHGIGITETNNSISKFTYYTLSQICECTNEQMASHLHTYADVVRVKSLQYTWEPVIWYTVYMPINQIGNVRSYR